MTAAHPDRAPPQIAAGASWHYWVKTTCGARHRNTPSTITASATIRVLATDCSRPSVCTTRPANGNEPIECRERPERDLKQEHLCRERVRTLGRPAQRRLGI